MISVDAALALLTEGELELEGLLVEASNATLRAYCSLDGEQARCVYKPVRGERPLWDFPDGTLAGREVAAYLVSAETGWDVVPPTVLRDGPLGPGACQLWIEDGSADGLVGFVPAADVPEGWLPVASARGPRGRALALAHADDERLARIAVFDAVVNNADRKGGHLLETGTGHVYGVDHGVCFHADDKLRTVLWGWAGGALPAELRDGLRGLADALAGRLGAALAEHVTPAEVAAARSRVERIVASGTFPFPDHDWPPIPWPPI